MQPMFEALLELVGGPGAQGVTTDDSILLVYPPDRELDFREELVDRFIPRLETAGTPFRLVDATGLPFEGLDDETIESLCSDEFEDYGWMVRGLAQRTEATFERHLRSAAAEVPGGLVVAFATVALFPLIRFGDTLSSLRDAPARIAVAFPGEDRAGKLHFLGQPDGGNYLAVRLSWE